MSTTTSKDPGGEATAIRPPPTRLAERLRHLGPGLIITGSIVGSGELIVTTGLGAKAGFSLLWLVVLGCFIKVFVQIELGRFAIASGETTLATMDRVPGPRLLVSWMLWLWAAMFICLIFQLSGILDGLAEVFVEMGAPLGRGTLAAAVAVFTMMVLLGGRYGLMERWSTILVFTFTVATVVAVAALQWTEHRIEIGDLLEGMRLHLGPDFTWAFAAFGITGVGASELIYYPYWCLEKGYARWVGPQDGSPEWLERARGWLTVMKLDAWLSFIVYTVATAAFYLLGAAVLYNVDPALRRVVKDQEMVLTLSHMYRESFGAWGLWIFLLGAFAVLFSTFFVATGSNARLLADGLSVFKVARYSRDGVRRRVVQVACVFLPVLNLVVLLGWSEQPKSLVFVGAVGQAIMLPFLGLLAVYLRHRRAPEGLRAGVAGTILLWVSFICMALVGIYQLVDKIRGLLGSGT